MKNHAFSSALYTGNSVQDRLKFTHKNSGRFYTSIYGIYQWRLYRIYKEGFKDMFYGRISLDTDIRMMNYSVVSTLLYGSECLKRHKWFSATYNIINITQTRDGKKVLRNENERTEPIYNIWSLIWGCLKRRRYVLATNIENFINKT